MGFRALETPFLQRREKHTITGNPVENPKIDTSLRILSWAMRWPAAPRTFHAAGQRAALRVLTAYRAPKSTGSSGSFGATGLS